MNISTTDALGLYTKMVVDAYKERIKPDLFLASFFPGARPTSALSLSIAVMRGSEKIAVDVTRGTDGNRNTFSKSTEKIFIPPYYREYFDHTSLDHYDMLFRANSISEGMFGEVVLDTTEKMDMLVDKIKRSHEKQRGEILNTGVMTFHDGTGQIDFKRKAGSLVDPGAGNYWADNEDLFAQFTAAGRWLRKNGKVSTYRLQAIMGEDAATAFQANTVLLARQNFYNMKLDSINPPQRTAQGGNYVGTITAGEFTVDLFTYTDYYEDPDNGDALTPYIDPKMVIVMPQNPHFRTGFAGVPQLLEPGQAPTVAEFHFTEYVDEKKRTKEYHVESASMPIPTAIDQIYTFRAVAA